MGTRGAYLAQRTLADRDDGCQVHPHCLTCPLPQCILDMGINQRQVLAAREQYKAIVEVHDREGLTVPQTAQRFGVGERTIFRALAWANGKARSAGLGE